MCPIELNKSIWNDFFTKLLSENGLFNKILEISPVRSKCKSQSIKSWTFWWKCVYIVRNGKLNCGRIRHWHHVFKENVPNITQNLERFYISMSKAIFEWTLTYILVMNRKTIAETMLCVIHVAQCHCGYGCDDWCRLMDLLYWVLSAVWCLNPICLLEADMTILDGKNRVISSFMTGKVNMSLSWETANELLPNSGTKMRHIGPFLITIWYLSSSKQNGTTYAYHPKHTKIHSQVHNDSLYWAMKYGSQHGSKR